jgi:hypothetical protein
MVFNATFNNMTSNVKFEKLALVYFLLIHIKETASVFVIVRILTSSAPVGSNQTIKLTFVTSP